MFSNLEDRSVPYFIGEIGINHNGDLKIAKRLIDGLHATGWDCAKFQKRNPDVCVPEEQKNVLRETPWGTLKYIDYKHHIEFGKKEYFEIDKYCKQKPMDWTASVWDRDSLKFILEYGVPFIKIASASITDLELVKECALSGVPIIMSTGMSTLEEVDDAVNTIIKNGKKPVIMHTNSSYPTPPNELNLSLIPFYKERYGCTVGYSGHEEDLEPTVVAVTLGAKVIERHVTLSHSMWGTDQKSSLEIHAMDMLYKRCKNISTIIGNNKKEVTPSELPIRKKLRKI
jgi:N-acetylneuraminate synthase